jgi:hypothetical protein
MILAAGTFRVADYRKPIPAHVKVQVVLNHVKRGLDEPGFDREKPAAFCFDCGVGEDILPSFNAAELEFDHCPALVNRDYDTEASDFVPPQNDPAYIIVRAKSEHLEKTTGRKAGATTTVTTRGSDVGEAKRSRDIRTTNAIHRAKMASKAGRFDEAASILASVKERKGKHRRIKRKIPSRPLNARHRSTDDHDPDGLCRRP